MFVDFSWWVFTVPGYLLRWNFFTSRYMYRDSLYCAVHNREVTFFSRSSPLTQVSQSISIRLYWNFVINLIIYVLVYNKNLSASRHIFFKIKYFLKLRSDTIYRRFDGNINFSPSQFDSWAITIYKIYLDLYVNFF